ncbi:MAG TPA: AAA family ATPase [Thermomicrobiales bacterium]
MNRQVTKVLVVDDNEKVRDELIEQLRYQDIEVVGESTFGAAAYTWAQQLGVEVVVVSVEEPVARSLRTVETLSVGDRSWPVIGISSQGDRETMRKAMMAGVRDFLVRPVAPDDLRAAILNVHRVEVGRRAAVEQGEAARRLGTVVTIAGFKGGIGKSTMATNVAVSLAQQTQQHVAMLDLDLQFGDAAVMLDVVPTHTIEHAAKEVDRLDPQLIQGYVATHPSRLRLLAAPATPEASDDITADQVGRILEMLASTNDFVIVDTPPHLDDVSAVAMDLSTLVLVVVAPEVPCIRRTKAALTLMQTWGYSRDKVKLIVNRVHRKSEVSIAEIEEVLQYPVYAQIPDDRATIKAISLGTPVAMSAPKSKAGRAINDLGRTLAGVPATRRRFTILRRGTSAKVSTMDRLLPPPPAPRPQPSEAMFAPLASTAAAGVNGSTSNAPAMADREGVWQPAVDSERLFVHSAYGREYGQNGSSPATIPSPYKDLLFGRDQPKPGD